MLMRNISQDATAETPHSFACRTSPFPYQDANRVRAGPSPPLRGNQRQKIRPFSIDPVTENNKGLLGQGSRLGAREVCVTTGLCPPTSASGRAALSPGGSPVLPGQ